MRRVPMTQRDARGREYIHNRAMAVLALLLLTLPTAATAAGTVLVTVETLPLPLPARVTVPTFTESPHGPILSWLETRGTGRHALRYAILDERGWREPRTVLDDRDFWISPADPPWLTAFDDGTLVAHWPRRSGAEWYDYETRMALKPPGEPWGETFLLHDDTSPVQHGLPSRAHVRSGLMHYLWLDERSGTVALRGRVLSRDGALGKDTLVEGRACSCCRIAMTTLADGTLLAAYRDRDDDEIRDIRVLRHAAATGWQPTGWISADGWKITGCPVNGPALASAGKQVALAWFTAAEDRNRVWLARSEDGGSTFDVPVRVDAGDPIGRPALLFDRAGRLLVAWLEQTATGPELLLRVDPDAANAGSPIPLGDAPTGFLAGYPRLIAMGATTLAFWSDGDSANLVKIRMAD
jgi:hypothetical protein